MPGNLLLPDPDIVYKTNPYKNVTIRPDGIHELDPTVYILKYRYANVTVEILENPETGNYTIGWYRQWNTDDISNL